MLKLYLLIFYISTQVEMNIYATPSLNPTSSAFHMTATKTAQTHSTLMWASARHIHVLDSWTMASGAKTK